VAAETPAIVSVVCDRCGIESTGSLTACPKCGGPVREDTRDSRPLAALRPEAEPPLPAAHEVLRTRTPPLGAQRRDPTPLPHSNDLGITPLPQADPSASRNVVAAIAPTPASSAPGPMEDPSSWFGKSELKDTPPSSAPVVLDPASDQHTPLMRPLRKSGPIFVDDETPEEPADASDYQSTAVDEAAPEPPVIRAQAPIGVPSLTLSAPTLIEPRRAWSRALVVIALCVIVGVVVGWLLSTPPPPTPEEHPIKHAH
jgi:hypothetical protein